MARLAVPCGELRLVEHDALRRHLAEPLGDAQVNLCGHDVGELVERERRVMRDDRLGFARFCTAPEVQPDVRLVFAPGVVAQTENPPALVEPVSLFAVVALVRVAVACFLGLRGGEIPRLAYGNIEEVYALIDRRLKRRFHTP